MTEQVPARRLVWRISPATPMGEFVDPARAVIAVPTAAALRDKDINQGWLESSLDLMNGMLVVENPEDDGLEGLFEDLWKPPAADSTDAT